MEVEGKEERITARIPVSLDSGSCDGLSVSYFDSATDATFQVAWSMFTSQISSRVMMHFIPHISTDKHDEQV
jgi:hypothetical protein